MATKKASPAQIAARKLFAARAKAGEFSRTPKKRAAAKAKNATTIHSRVDAAEAALRIAKKIKARLTNPSPRERHPIDAGEFTMTVNGKAKTRFFFHTTDPWAKKHGFPYQLESVHKGGGAFVKFGKTVAYVCDDESETGAPVIENWTIRALKFYERKTNPRMRQTMQGVGQQTRMVNPRGRKASVSKLHAQKRAGNMGDTVYIVEASKDKRYWQFQKAFMGPGSAKECAQRMAAEHPHLYLRVKSEKAEA